MRTMLLGAFVLALAACGPTTTEAPIAETPVTVETFEDGGCLGVLLAHRAAVTEGRAQGDAAALTAAIEAWRTAGSAILSANELAQYEASSFAGESHEHDDVVTERANICFARTPHG